MCSSSPNLSPSFLQPLIGNQFYCFLVYCSCISFCKSKRIDILLFSHFSFFLTQKVVPYMCTFALCSLPGRHSTCIYGDVHTRGRLSSPHVICCSFSKRWNLFPLPSDLGCLCDLLWTTIAPVLSDVQVYFCVFRYVLWFSLYDF